MRPAHMSIGLSVLASLLVSCAGPNDGTLRSIEGRGVAVERDIAEGRSGAAAGNRSYLDALPRQANRPEATPGLAERDSGEVDTARTPGAYRELVRVYEERLQAYPNSSDNDYVLYRLARAYDELGESKRTLAVLDRLVADYPASRYRAEAHFRRGEIAFSMQAYRQAERAYAEVQRQGEHSAFYERALFMQSWSLFKQGRLEEALSAFFVMLDRKLTGRDIGASLEALPGLTRTDRELVEDTFRVVSLILAGLQGVGSIPAFMETPTRRRYEVYVYRELAGLYLTQQRVKDAADTFAAFVRLHPSHPHAPFMQARVIEIYQQAGFAALTLEAKQEYVTRYGVLSEYRRANGPVVYAQVVPQVKRNLEELSRHFHALAQRGKKADDYREAVRWYRTYVESFPEDSQTPAMNFLLAEILFEQEHFKEAAEEYERTAYRYSNHAKGADAGYAALFAYAREEKTTTGEGARAIRVQSAESALRFAATHPQDARVAGVLADAAEKLYALESFDKALTIAQRVIALGPSAAPALRRAAWTVVGHIEFERGAFDRAEQAYREALALTPAGSPHLSQLTERLAAAFYKQGEQARAAGKTDVAASQFLRVGQIVPQASIRANADYDAAAALMALKDWSGAARLLEDFRRNHPKHPLQADVPAKLAVCYLESGESLKAAVEFETVASDNKNATLSREALWQAAELFEEVAQDARAAAAFDKYTRQYPAPFSQMIEARYRLVEISRRQGRHAERYRRSRELVEAEKKGGAERSARTLYLGALHMLVAAEPLDEAYRNVRLTEPLKQTLKIKKDKMQQVLHIYSVATDYGVTDIASAVTYRTAELYRDFGKALLESQRPTGLSKEEREQYDVLLEEQAFPFEEKAIDLHEVNVRRVRAGFYDDWTKKSFETLSQLLPIRYAKTEKTEATAVADPKKAAYYNESGIALRRAGKFEEARQAYAKALDLDSGYAYAHLNLGILYDLYLQDADKAMTQYRRYGELVPAEAQTVQKWIADVQQRARAGAQAKREKAE